MQYMYIFKDIGKFKVMQIEKGWIKKKLLTFAIAYL